MGSWLLLQLDLERRDRDWLGRKKGPGWGFDLVLALGWAQIRTVVLRLHRAGTFWAQGWEPRR